MASSVAKENTYIVDLGSLIMPLALKRPRQDDGDSWEYNQKDIALGTPYIEIEVAKIRAENEAETAEIKILIFKRIFWLYHTNDIYFIYNPFDCIIHMIYIQSTISSTGCMYVQYVHMVTLT